MQRPKACVECGSDFAIVDRYEDFSTCKFCAEKLRISNAGECDECHRIIEPGEKYHMEWVKYCGKCARREKLPLNRESRSVPKSEYQF
ncbi:hypothetical protein VN12_06495 [Pirellula sp. SH-Sr6A]|uniref:hypothetical protein n=1 Tax=Pirellula sp. SH-Sr6A TaxID=1632865 RepID=UPI00078B2392|nr:hypothetical protein [Pirellula sp. SH-Sr6A]AMV31752.1 hypothetical protein VN12_06495 [Pirellula sp. SH-Sr6A]